MLGGNLDRYDPLRRFLVPLRRREDVVAALEVATAAEAMLLDAMRQLRTRSERTWPSPQPVRLVLHRTARTAALRWRMCAARRQGRDFLELDAESELGRAVLDRLPPTRQRWIVAIQTRALLLNTSYAIHRRKRDVLARHLRKLDALEATRAHFERAPELPRSRRA